MNVHSKKSLRDGTAMPIMGLGTWHLQGDTAVDIVAEAFHLGYRMVDTSGDYKNQPQIAQALHRTNVRRGDQYLVTKVEETDDAYQAAKTNLAELDVAYADLILIHRPPPDSAGVELWEGLIKAKRAGLARSIGVSNYTVEDIEDIIDATGEIPVVNQIEWSPFGYSAAMKDFCDDNEIVIMAYSPLTRHRRLQDARLDAVAAKHGKTPAQVLIRWNIQIGTVPIPKASQRQHLQENADVFDFELDQDDMRQVDALNEHYSALSRLPYA